jgi:hypothetical protein
MVVAGVRVASLYMVNVVDAGVDDGSNASYVRVIVNKSLMMMMMSSDVVTL